MNVSSTSTRRLLLILLPVLVYAGYLNSFVQDDAYISFRYAHNLVHENELTWNAGSGELIEGYTNFLWTMMMAVPIALDLDPVPFSKLTGLVFFFGTLVFTFKLSSMILESSSLAVLAVMLLGTNYTFSAYATGGLETQMQAFLVVASVHLALSMVLNDSCHPSRLLSLSLLWAIALLTRLDSSIPVLVLGIYVLTHIIRRDQSRARLWKDAVLLGMPVVLIIGPWLLWKAVYYGELLPNTYYAKAGVFSFEIFLRGLFYVYEFLKSYLLVPFVFLAMFAHKKITSAVFGVLLSIIAIWIGYIIKIGGGFMEFRLLVPILPLAYVVIVRLIASVGESSVRGVLIAIIYCGSLMHAMTFNGVMGIDPIKRLEDQLESKRENWDGIGLTLNELFADAHPPVILATPAAGAIPYYSQLRTIDMHGLNDHWIARHGVLKERDRPGHQKRATLRYLVESGANLVMAYPFTRGNGYPLESRAFMSRLSLVVADIEPALMPADAKIVEIPFGALQKIRVLYLVQNDSVDRVIEAANLATISVVRNQP